MQVQKFLAEQLEGFEWPEHLTVLVCGGRGFGDVPPDIYATKAQALYQDRIRQKNFIWSVLDELWYDQGFVSVDGILVHGDATGADRAAGEWAKQQVSHHCQNIKIRPYPADWKKHGKSAGSIRNQFMLYDSQPHIVIAFPGGRGTADMVRKAKYRGGKVIEVPYPLS